MTINSKANARDSLQVVLANPRGFCAGVVRAVETVERALARYGPPVYVRHEIVHNGRVVEELRAKGAIFVEEVSSIPPGAVTVLSAHGVPRTAVVAADARGLAVIDATCPLVAKVHAEGRRFAAQGLEVVLIGHHDHPEVVSTRGQIEGVVHVVQDLEEAARFVPADPTRLGYITQTTLSVDDVRAIVALLRSRFPAILGPAGDDICYASQNRQSAVRALAARVQLVIVIGAANSSNSNRLREIAAECGTPSLLIPDANGLDRARVDELRSIGVTAGASAPEVLVKELLDRLASWRRLAVATLDGPQETVRFNLPRAIA
ncbi:4-hydroxy-3-methylbut-2-enyl diphosphate reductase [Falsiroseomonas sp.]|uniref:4-hydroxy-3-methylbut-2-enyl diphosphate reductase n=1 Tax=Falsiroseomonas sp. TaxID=2870721 RepID=UPI0035671709